VYLIAGVISATPLTAFLFSNVATFFMDQERGSVNLIRNQFMRFTKARRKGDQQKNVKTTSIIISRARLSLAVTMQVRRGYFFFKDGFLPIINSRRISTVLERKEKSSSGLAGFESISLKRTGRPLSWK
jgi:hypothetical protein